MMSDDVPVHTGTISIALRRHLQTLDMTELDSLLISKGVRSLAGLMALDTNERAVVNLQFAKFGSFGRLWGAFRAHWHPL